MVAHDEGQDAEHDHERAEAYHEAKRAEGQGHGRAVFLGEVLEALDHGRGAVEGHDAEDARNAADGQAVALIGRIRDGEQVHGGVGGGFPVGFHGRELGRLDLGHDVALPVADQGHGHGEDQGKGGADAKRLGEEIDALAAQQVPGRDAEHEKAGQGQGAGHGVQKLVPGIAVGDDLGEARQFGPAVPDGIAHRVLHEAVGQDDPDGREVGGDGHKPDGRGVELGRELVPAEDPHADEGGFQEKGGRGLDGQKRAEDVAHVCGIA